jgi:hypothetical protein
MGIEKTAVVSEFGYDLATLSAAIIRLKSKNQKFY